MVSLEWLGNLNWRWLKWARCTSQSILIMRLNSKKIFDRCVQLIDTHAPWWNGCRSPVFRQECSIYVEVRKGPGCRFCSSLSRDLHIAEYAPRKIKKSVTGSGAASKEQVSAMVQRIFKIPQSSMPNNLDATDGIAVALCHHYQLSSPEMKRGVSGWKAFIKENPSRVKDWIIIS